MLTCANTRSLRQARDTTAPMVRCPATPDRPCVAIEFGLERSNGAELPPLRRDGEIGPSATSKRGVNSGPPPAPFAEQRGSRRRWHPPWRAPRPEIQPQMSSIIEGEEAHLKIIKGSTVG